MLSIIFKSTLQRIAMNDEKKSFNILNESHLHHTLKVFFKTQNPGSKLEVPYKQWICDIETEDQGIIEIQTGNILPLKAKIKEAIKDKRNITIVHPVITEKKIEVYTRDGTLVSKRKSPKKENIFDALKTLTGIYDLLLTRYVTIIFIEVKTTEQRIQTDEKIQLPNKSRHFMKNWYKAGKELSEIGTQHTFHGKKSYLALLPKLSNNFSSLELKEAFNEQDFPKSAQKHANLILWLYSRMGLIQYTEKRGRRNYYRLSE